MIVCDHDLQSSHTLRCPSRTEFWVALTDLKQLPEVHSWWRRQRCPLQFLGQGSNVLCPPWVSGLTLSNELQGHWVEAEDSERVRVRVASGVNWHQWVLYCADQGWHGLENLALIPGTIGASPVQNIGAYGVEVATCIVGVRAFNWHTGEIKEFSPAECHFAYRNSVFKASAMANWLITEVVFELSKSFKPRLSYAPLDQLESQGIDAHQLIAEVCRIRQQKLPSPEQMPNVGSFFTNPMVPKHQAELLRNQDVNLPIYPMTPQWVKVSAAYLIDQAGWRGWQDKDTGVGTWLHHALVIINPKHQSLPQVLEVAHKIQNDILARFQIKLEIEPQRIDSQSMQP